MKNGLSKVHASIALLVVAFNFAAAIAAEKAELAEAARMSVRGQVVTPSGDPQVGARVILRAASTPPVVGLIDYDDVIAETTSDANGKFVFEKVALSPEISRVLEDFQNGRRGANVLAFATGYGIGWAPVSSIENPDEIKVALRRAAILEGVVSGPDNKLLLDAEINVTGFSPIGAPFDGFLSGPDDLRLLASSLRPKATTDAHGRFRIEQLPAECRIHLRVHHPDYHGKYLIASTGGERPAEKLSYQAGREKREIMVEPSPINVILAAGPRLRVRVVDAQSDKSIPKGSIAVLRQSREWNTSIRPDGTAAITVAEPGEYRVYFLPPQSNDGLGMSQEATLTEAHVSAPLDVVLRLPSRRIVEGRVVGKGTETGLAGLTVAWRPADETDAGQTVSYWSRTRTMPDGRFRLPIIPGSGKLTLDGDVPDFFIPSYRTVPRAEADKYAIPVVVPHDSDLEPLKIEVPRGMVVRGVVRDVNGVAASQITVRAISNGRYAPRLREAMTDDGGQFELKGLHPRESYTLTAQRVGGIASHVIPDEPSHVVEETREVAVVLLLEPSITLRGRVLLAGNPLPNIQVKLLRGQRIDHDRTRYHSIAEAKTDENGWYKLGGLKPGDRYHVEIKPPFEAVDPDWTHQSPYVQTLPLAAKEVVDLPDAHLLRMSQTLAGIVVDPDGKPVVGASVGAQGSSGGLFRVERLPPPWTETDKEGRFRLTHLPDRPLELMAYIRPKGPDRSIRFPAIVQCERNQQDIKIILDPSLLEDD